MYIEEGKRLSMFIERVCRLSQRKFVEVINKELTRLNPDAKTFNPSEVNKMLSGKTLISIAVIKATHRLWKLNYNWLFEGVGSMQTDRDNQRKMANDVTEILATVLVLESSMQSLKKTVNNLAADYYAHKQGISSN